MAFFRLPLGLDSVGATPVSSAPTSGNEPISPSTAVLQPTGFDQQDSGGQGNPYVGSGWNNLSNFLNKENIDWGHAQQGQPDPMDLSQNRSQSQADFENWMWGAGGRTPKPESTVKTPEEGGTGPNKIIDLSGVPGPMFPNGVPGWSPFGYTGPDNSAQPNSNAPDDNQPSEDRGPPNKRKDNNSFSNFNKYVTSLR